MTSNGEIIFGGLPLLAPLSSGGDYEIDVCADGTDYGNPAAVVAEVASMLMDGEKAKITRFGNRTAVLELRIKGSSLDAVTAGTAAIEAEVNRGRNTLTWLPPDWATPSVFDVVYSTLDFKTDDLSELRVTRYFTLTLVCQPFARRMTLTTVIADPLPAVAPVVTSVDDCTSATGWSTSTSLTSSGGAIVVDTAPVSSKVLVSRTGLSAPLGAGEYVALDIEGYWPGDVQFTINGDEATLATKEPLSANRNRWYLTAKGATTLASLGLTFKSPAGPSIKIHDVSIYDHPASTSIRQRSFTAQVNGTARTTADLVVEATSGLGDEVLIFTAPVATAIDPPMRHWMTGSVGDADASAASGYHNDFDGSRFWTIPLSAIPPGMHSICARLQDTAGSNDVTFTWSAEINTGPWASGTPTEGGSVTVPLTPSWGMQELAVAMLPPIETAIPSSSVLTISIDTASTTALLDDLYLFNLDAGVLTLLSDLTVSGETPSKVEVRSATIDRDRPAWVAGTAGTDLHDISVADRAASPGQHEFRPGVMSIFVVTPSAVDGQTVSVEYYERFQHHVTAQVS